MSGDRPVRFLCEPDDAERAVSPRTAEEVYRADPAVDPVAYGAAETDRRASDLVNRGWFVSPPATVTLDPGAEPPVRPAGAAEYVTVHEDRAGPDHLAATVDTLWSVAVDEGCPVLVTSWTAALDGRVVPRLVVAEDGPTALAVPVTTDEPVTYDRGDPIAQVVPLPGALLEASSETGVPDDRTRERIGRIERSRSMPHHQYAERWWVEKAPTELVDRAASEE